MKLTKRYIALGTMAMGLLSGLAAHAGELNEETKVNFSAPIEIPGMVLPAGTYTFKLADAGTSLATVQILNASETRVYATMETIPAYREKVTGRTQVTLAETRSGNVPALTQWFHSGRHTGYEFIYSSKQEPNLEQAKQQTVIAQPATPAQLAAGE